MEVEYSQVLRLWDVMGSVGSRACGIKGGSVTISPSSLVKLSRGFGRIAFLARCDPIVNKSGQFNYRGKGTQNVPRRKNQSVWALAEHFNAIPSLAASVLALPMQVSLTLNVVSVIAMSHFQW